VNEPYTIILAPNPSLMTGPGTNTIIVGSGAEGATVIDPAVDDAAYLDAIIAEGKRRGGIKRILITHGHHDHTDGAAVLRGRTGVAVYSYSKQSIPPTDIEIGDGAIFPAGNDTLRAIYTPGHRNDHLSFLLEKQKTLFAGDIVAGVGTVVIIPPEGEMQEYLETLQRLQGMAIAEIVPAHGPIITSVQEKLQEYIDHRLQREQQVLDALEELPPGVGIPRIVAQVYADVDPRLHPVAAWSVEAHLIKLEREGLVERLNDGWTLTEPTA
jgi:glyoxylase-like metal-dependent hydrolase (beta-lactamase superfamily II)